MGNIIIGILLVIGGLSGKLALRGTNSSVALIVLGGAIIAWGLWKLRGKEE